MEGVRRILCLCSRAPLGWTAEACPHMGFLQAACCGAILHRCYEAISAPRKGLDIARTGGRIAQDLAQFINGGVQAVVEIHEGIGGPELLAQLFARDDISGALKQQGEYLERLLLQAELFSTPAPIA